MFSISAEALLSVSIIGEGVKVLPGAAAGHTTIVACPFKFRMRMLSEASDGVQLCRQFSRLSHTWIKVCAFVVERYRWNTWLEAQMFKNFVRTDFLCSCYSGRSWKGYGLL